MPGTPDEAVRFFNRRHGLVSFAHPGQIEVLASVCSSFVLDNGAFTVWKRGGVLDVQGYYAWCDKWLSHPACEWALIPDVIEGSEEENDELIDRWPHGKAQGVPVWHYHESLERLERLVNEWPRVALGSSGEWPVPGKPKWWRRTAEVMSVACDSKGRPKCKLHGLRMLAPSIFTHMPLASADSTNAARNAQYDAKWSHGYAPRAKWLRATVIAESVESQQSAMRWVGPPLKVRPLLSDGLFQQAWSNA